MDGADYSVAQAVTDSVVIVARAQRSILTSAALIARTRVALERSAALLEVSILDRHDTLADDPR